jgi:hypothetical protein
MYVMKLAIQIIFLDQILNFQDHFNKSSNLNLKISNFIVLDFQRYATLLITMLLNMCSDLSKNPVERSREIDTKLDF